ncbi:MAG: ethanolamine utilization protein EutH [Oscillibacter sp.]|nr:ethanolamine utilization protein EutH [Oscillibacter sp.]
MTFNDIILWIVAIGVVIGGVDKLLGNKFGLGSKFDDGFNAMGPLALSVAGIVVLAPVLATWLQPVLVPLFGLMDADPAMFAAIIANDMGGYSLAMSLAQNHEIGLMSGCITAAMLGCTLVFSLPVGLGLIEKCDRPYFFQGLLIGLITIPVGSIVGGLVAGFNTKLVLINNIPIIIFSLLLVLGLKFAPNAMNKGASAFGTFIGWVAIVGIIIGSFTHLTGVKIPFFESADTMLAGMEIVAYVVIVLIGILPVLELLTRLLNKALLAFGKLLGIDAVSAGGLIFTLANSVPVYGMIKNMSRRGKVINVAWLVPATAALGDHLGFTAGVEPEMITPMIVGKLVAGVCAVVIACWMTRSWRGEEPIPAAAPQTAE